MNKKAVHVGRKTDDAEAEDMFTELWDPKLKCFTDEAKLVCQCLKIEEASLLPGMLQTFYSKLKDKEMATLHLEFYRRKRVKNLQKIQHFLQVMVKERRRERRKLGSSKG